MIDKFTIFIKKGKSLLFLLSFVILPVSIQAQSQIKSINTLEDKIYGLSLLWSELKYNFVNIDRLGFDLDSLYRETMKRVIDTKDDVSYYKELDCFLNRFNDAHTNLFDYPDSGYERTILITERNILAGNIISLNIKRIVLILIQTCLVPKL